MTLGHQLQNLLMIGIRNTVIRHQRLIIQVRTLQNAY